MIASDAVFYSALAFMFGVATAGFGWPVATVIGIGAMTGLAVLAISHRLQLWKYLLLFVALIFIGAFYFHFRVNLTNTQRNLVFDKEIEFSGVVVGEPRGFEKYQIATLRAEPPFSGKVALFLPPLAQIGYGDLLRAKGVIKPPSSSGKELAVFFPEIEILEHGRGNKIKSALLGFKAFLVGQFKKHLGPDESALLSGITFGVRSGFSEKSREAMAKSGTTHIVALSGYNITILVLAVSFVLGSFVSRRKNFYFTAAIIALFVLMVGGEPSVVRAAIMGLLALLAKEVGRMHDMRNAIALTAAAMVLVSPTILANDAGFQLSFASLLGIVYLSPVLQRLLRVESEGFAAWKENALLTASAQLAVLPIIVNTFGEFSAMAILANALILGFVPLTMFLGFLLAALSSIYVHLGFLAAKLVELLLNYELWIMEFFSKIRLPITAPPIAPMTFFIGYYALLALFVYHFSKHAEAKTSQ